MKFIFFIASAILIFTRNACKQLGTTKHILQINPAAIERTVKLFNFIQDIQGEYTLSGQHNFVGKGSDYSDQLEKITGKKAIIWGSDFSFCVEGENALRYQHCGPANLTSIPLERFKARRDSIARDDSVAPRQISDDHLKWPSVQNNFAAQVALGRMTQMVRKKVKGRI
jgi:hypothetical protein